MTSDYTKQAKQASLNFVREMAAVLAQDILKKLKFKEFKNHVRLDNQSLP